MRTRLPEVEKPPNTHTHTHVSVACLSSPALSLLCQTAQPLPRFSHGGQRLLPDDRVLIAKTFPEVMTEEG